MAGIKTANVIGLGLIGGSVAAGLKARGWTVCGSDRDPARESEAMSRGITDSAGLDPDAAITFVATPVKAIAEGVRMALSATHGLVTDVGSVKAPLSREFDDERYIGGHPMAGSELDGLDGADPSLFEGAVWIVTPRRGTTDVRFAELAGVIRELGAEVIALPAEKHDELVATVSHVPHLTAATLMNVAQNQSTEHAALLRLAAGGFRDMTRIASGSPNIWLDICESNRDAIVTSLTELIDGLTEVRAIVADGDRVRLLQRLTAARSARTNLPARVASADNLAEIRIAIPDRAGAAAEVFTLAAELGVNIYNFEIVHSVEGQQGVLLVIVEESSTDLLRGGLVARGFRPVVAHL
mgnify:CR=1 FL=1